MEDGDATSAKIESLVLLHRNWPYKPSVVLHTHQSMLKNAYDSRADSSVSSGS